MPSKLIAITANTSWYLYNFRSNLIKGLLEEGYQILAIAPLDDYSKRLEALGNDVKFRSIKIDQGGTNPIKDLQTTLEFYRIYRSARPDVVLNFTPKNNIYSTLAASRFHIPVINNIAGLGSVFIQEGMVSRIARFLYRISQKHASHIFFQNQEDRDLFLQADFVNPDLTERLPGSGVDLVRFTEIPLPDSGSFRFLLVARLLYEKGVEEYAMAAKYLKTMYPQIECRVVGMLDSKNPSAIPRHVIEEWHKKGYILFLGSTDNIEEEIAKVHCLVLPSYYREGVPRSLLEGAAMGRIIITTDNVGCRETVENGKSGFLCEPKSIEDLAKTMEKVISMEADQQQQFGSFSRKHAESKFDENIVTRSYKKQILASLL